MMEAKIATFSGMATGLLTNMLTGNLVATLAVAMMTGAAAYIGQQIAKYAHRKNKGWFDKITKLFKKRK